MKLEAQKLKDGEWGRWRVVYIVGRRNLIELHDDRGSGMRHCWRDMRNNPIRPIESAPAEKVHFVMPDILFQSLSLRPLSVPLKSLQPLFQSEFSSPPQSEYLEVCK